MTRVVPFVSLLVAGCFYERISPPPAPETLPACAAPVERSSLRLASWNIHKGDDAPLEVIADNLALLEADVIALQEVRVRVSGLDSPDQPAELARALTLRTGHRYEAVFAAARRDGAGYFGNAVLSRIPMTAPERIDLHEGWIQQPRAGLLVRLCTATPLTLVAVHLDHLNPLDTARTLRRRLEPLFGGGVVVAGDFNATQDEVTIRELVHGGPLVDASRGTPSTFPLLDRRIDYVLVEAGLFSARPEPLPVRFVRHASDHLPVVVTLEPRERVAEN